MNALAVLGCTVLGVVVGFTLGVRTTASRYQRALNRLRDPES
jgi:hypothetical protein